MRSGWAACFQHKSGLIAPQWIRERDRRNWKQIAFPIKLYELDSELDQIAKRYFQTKIFPELIRTGHPQVFESGSYYSFFLRGQVVYDWQNPVDNWVFRQEGWCVENPIDLEQADYQPSAAKGQRTLKMLLEPFAFHRARVDFPGWFPYHLRLYTEDQRGLLSALGVDVTNFRTT